jgi:hypothetical protein
MSDNDDDAMRRLRIAQYRRIAADVRARAENMKDQTVREQLLDIARQYEQLASSIERLPQRGD